MGGDYSCGIGVVMSDLYQKITDICAENGGVTKPMVDKLKALIDKEINTALNLAKLRVRGEGEPGHPGEMISVNSVDRILKSLKGGEIMSNERVVVSCNDNGLRITSKCRIPDIHFYAESGSVHFWATVQNYDDKGIEALQYLDPLDAMEFAKAMEKCAIQALKDLS